MLLFVTLLSLGSRLPDWFQESDIWKTDCFFLQMSPGTTKKKIQRSPRNFNPRSNKQKNNINFFQLKSNLQTSNNVGSSNHPVIINVKALLLSADAPRDNEKENPTTQAFFFLFSLPPYAIKSFFPRACRSS